MPRSDTAPRRIVRAEWLGRVPYGDASSLQSEQVRRRHEGKVPDTLFLLEHPHVITLGTGSSDEHVLAGPEERARRGIELHEAGRGGDVTYHGPGQLVGYPILDLKPDRKDLHRYLRDLEVALIRALAHWNVEGWPEEGLTGVWTEFGKIAAIGVRVSSGWITSHGFALNVDTDLSYFEAIVPCGIQDRRVATLSGILGRAVTMEEAIPIVAGALAETFDRELRISSRTPAG
jgi:lipoyl(octanoyl) transferase